MIEPKNKELYLAVKNYLLFAEQWLESLFRSQAIPRSMEAERLVGKINDELKDSQHYQDCLAVLHSDPVISGHFVGVGTIGHWWMLLQPWHVMRSLLYLNLQDGWFHFNAKQFDQQYTEFEDAFYNDQIRYIAIALLPTLVAETGNIKLSDKLELGLINQEEKRIGHMFGVIDSSAHWAYSNLFVIRTEYHLKKFIGSSEQYHQSKQRHQITIKAQCDESIDQVVTALRLFKGGDVFHEGIMHWSHTWLRKGLHTGSYVARPKIYGQQHYYLNADEVDDFRTFWSKLKGGGVKGRKFLDIAVRRFSYSSERSRAEDEIIDLLISAEALFLSDVKNESYRGELTYRLSLRAGFFLGTNSEEQKEIYKHMRKAYEIRSAIVHGAASLNLPKQKDGRSFELEHFVKITEGYIRAAIHKAITLASQPQTPHSLINWDDLIFAAEGANDKERWINSPSGADAIGDNVKE